MAERAERRERRRLIDARFPLIKRLEEFRFDDNPKVPQATIAALAECSWIDDRESVVSSVNRAAARHTSRQRWRSAPASKADACGSLRSPRSRTSCKRPSRAGSTAGSLAATTAPAVCLDELGYLNLPDGAAELVFQVISERNERGSLIVTTNLSFGDWTKVFPDRRLAKAVVDRITHKAHIIDTGTESWRFRHGLERQRRKRA